MHDVGVVTVLGYYGPSDAVSEGESSSSDCS